MDEIEKAMKNARANLELSGFTVTEEHEKLVRARLNGEMTEEEFLKRVLELANAKTDS